MAHARRCRRPRDRLQRLPRPRAVRARVGPSFAVLERDCQLAAVDASARCLALGSGHHCASRLWPGLQSADAHHDGLRRGAGTGRAVAVEASACFGRGLIFGDTRVRKDIYIVLYASSLSKIGHCYLLVVGRNGIELWFLTSRPIGQSRAVACEGVESSIVLSDALASRKTFRSMRAQAHCATNFNVDMACNVFAVLIIVTFLTEYHVDIAFGQSMFVTLVSIIQGLESLIASLSTSAVSLPAP